MFEWLSTLFTKLGTLFSWKRDNSPNQTSSSKSTHGHAVSTGHNSTPQIAATIYNTTYVTNPSENDDAQRKLKHLLNANPNSEVLWLSSEEESQLAPLIRYQALIKTGRKANNAINRQTYEYKITDSAKRF